jgi:hypothetical protein
VRRWKEHRKDEVVCTDNTANTRPNEQDAVVAWKALRGWPKEYVASGKHAAAHATDVMR